MGLGRRDAFDPATAMTEAEARTYRDEQRRQRTQLLMERVTSTREGRELVAGLLDLTGVYASSFSTNALSMGYREGRRSVGLDLMALLNPNHYQLMLKERNDRRSSKRGDDDGTDAAGHGDGSDY